MSCCDTGSRPLRAGFSLLLAMSLLAQQTGEVPVFQASSNLVVVTVYVRDKDGKPVERLSKDSFTILENGKPQSLAVFEFQDLAPPEKTLQVRPDPAEPKAAAPKIAEAVKTASGRARFRDRRLMVLFFDWTSLEQADQIRAVEAAEKFVRTQLSPADLLSIVSFGSRLKTEQEFTDDKDALLKTLGKFQPGLMSELSQDANTEEDTSEDASFAADETEFNLFNTDRKLGALEDLARSLEALPEKKAVLYFSSGVSKTGTDNESQLRATTNAAVRANVSFYPLDVRGLMAMAPGGNASEAGARGTGLYSGQGQRKAMGRISDKQETLDTLAADTGGKALLDNNDLTTGIRQAQVDLQSYYILGYYSADDRKDGRFRKVEVKLSAGLQAKLDYRSGYYAPKDFQAYSSYDKERQLQDALMLGDPVTQIPLALEANFFRLSKDSYFVPLALKIPGSMIPVAKKGATESTKFDFIGEIRGDKGVIAANVRDEIKIQLREQNAGQMANKSLVYDTGFVLAPGTYKVKMLVRENLTGKMGTFESSFTVPNLGQQEKDTLRMSSVVWSGQRQAVGDAVGLADKKLKKQSDHPLVRSGQKLIPSVTRVFRTDQSLFVYAEVYEPGTLEDGGQPRVAATVSLFRNRQKVLESRTVQMTTFLPTRNKTVPILIEIPLKDVKPGEYTAQINLIDQAGQRFAFERARVVIVKS